MIDGGYRYSYGAIINQMTGAVSFAQPLTFRLPWAALCHLPTFLGRGRAPGVTLTGGTGIGSPTAPYNDFNVNHTVYGNVAKVVGTHTLRFGAIFYHYNKHENQLSGANNGSYSFDAVNAPTSATRFGGAAVCTGIAGAAGATCPFS